MWRCEFSELQGGRWVGVETVIVSREQVQGNLLWAVLCARGECEHEILHAIAIHIPGQSGGEQHVVSWNPGACDLLPEG